MFHLTDQIAPLIEQRAHGGKGAEPATWTT